MGEILQILILGLALGGVIALMGSGLSLTFGVMRIVNLAHPAMIIAGAYIAYWAFRLWRIDPMLMLPVASIVMAAVGVVLYWRCSGKRPKSTNIRDDGAPDFAWRWSSRGFLARSSPTPSE